MQVRFYAILKGNCWVGGYSVNEDAKVCFKLKPVTLAKCNGHTPLSVSTYCVIKVPPLQCLTRIVGEIH